MTQVKQRIVSGMRPTGKLHLGHYFGVIRNWLQLQDSYDCFFFVADWHALTTDYNRVEIIQNSIRDVVLDWLASGVDPEKSCVFVQSHVPEHAELHLLLSMITPLGWLERVPSYKELKQELKDKDLSTYGFLGYPLLQTADVGLYKAQKVPVGQDQVAHIELSREVLRRFNKLFNSDLFPEPAELLTKTAKIVGTDGRKMSKSYNNTLSLSDSEDDFNKKIRSHFTDPARQRRDDPGNPDVCPIFDYHKELSSPELIEEINRDCRSAAIGCVDCKKKLIETMNDHFADFRKKRASLEKDTDYLHAVLAKGRDRAREIAAQTMSEVKKLMGLV